MQNKEWQKVEMIFHAALGLENEERLLYIHNACEGNNLLRSEVESLIDAFEEKPDFMNKSVFNLGLEAMGSKIASSNGNASLVNRTIGFYKINKKLGSGGMGDVYLAEDVRLNRKVALKFLANSFAGNTWGEKQLLREAQAIAMLEHPNICTVYGIEETDEFQYIVMQYIEGETLSRIIERKEILPDQILIVAKQIIEALSAAHTHGIIHLDVKPGNVMITPNGQVIVLDFGLAKIIGETRDSEKLSENKSQISQKGLVFGTIAYMSPEQLKAEELDYRSDIFSLGILLAELSTFSHPFAYESEAETISAILTGEPQYKINYNSRLPSNFHWVVKKCLEKDKEKRYQTAGGLLFDFQNSKQNHRFANFNRVYFRFILVFLCLVSIIFAGFISRRAVGVRTLAVLPFVNESSDAALEYLGDGMAEDFINRLSISDKLRVKSFTSVAGYKGNKIDPVETGRKLEVDAVLVGKISRVNNQLMLTAKLIDTFDGTQIWGAENVIKDTGILDLQTDISERIIKRLEPWGTSSPQKDARSENQTTNPEAYNLYLKGQYFWQKRDKDNIQKAINFFNQAIETDPTYAKAYAGLADSYILLSSVAYGSTSTYEATIKARAAAKKALEIDAGLCEPHTSLGVILLRYDWNFTAAEREFRQAIALNDDYAPAHFWYSILLSVTERPDEALVEGKKARELDPFSQLSKSNISRLYYFARRYDEALEALTTKDENTLESNAQTQYMLGLVYIQKKMYKEAITIYEDLYQSDKSLGGAVLGYCYAKTGRREKAQQILAEQSASQNYFPPQEKAIIYTGLNEKKKALECLNQAYEDRFASLISLKVEPLFDDLRSEPEYTALIKQIFF